MNYDIVTIGPLLVEIMRKELDKPLDIAADFSGPYPSGDAAIMLNAAAKLGAKTAMIGVVGEDAFGRNVTNRLEENGVDCSMIRKDEGASTGVAFVSYNSDGSRNFLYHVRHASCGRLTSEDVKIEKLKDTKWVQISGFTMSVNEKSKEAVYKIIREIPQEVNICFDPNIRPEALSVEEIKEMCGPVIERASLIVPSKSEAAMLTGAENDEEGCRMWASQGKIVVLKNGEKGCRIYSGDQVTDVPSFPSIEVDPTGAGDTFCGAFLVALTEGKDLNECGKFANGAGALSVQKLGPMEGAPSREELEAYLKEKE